MRNDTERGPAEETAAHAGLQDASAGVRGVGHIRTAAGTVFRGHSGQPGQHIRHDDDLPAAGADHDGYRILRMLLLPETGAGAPEKIP